MSIYSSSKIGQLINAFGISPIGYYAVWPDKSRHENLTLMLVRFIAE
ncbi:hypothetical protein ACM9HF_00115 [Colwellia sp. RE-S-Sl-9]